MTQGRVISKFRQEGGFQSLEVRFVSSLMTSLMAMLGSTVPRAEVHRSDYHLRLITYYLPLVSPTNPRSFNIGAVLGSAPSHAEYAFARSSVLPIDSTIARNRSPFARVIPPWSSNHWYASSSSISLHRYA